MDLVPQPIPRRHRRAPIRVALALLLRLAPAGALLAPEAAALQEPKETQEAPPTQVRTEIPYRDGTVVLMSDTQERVEGTRYRAKGNVRILYQDVEITCDEAEYDEATQRGSTKGPTRFSQGPQWLECSRAEFDFREQTGTFYDAEGFTDKEFLIRGSTIRKTGPDTYTIENGNVTSCQEDNPKWSFRASSARVRVDRTARLRNMVFKIKGVPVFYAPYLVLPMEKKERSSGFLPFRTGTSTSKGRLFSQGYFQTLGNSADATLHVDYFTLRGVAIGGILRARPSAQSRLNLQAYGINDKLQQGGAQVAVDGEAFLPNGFRAVARVNLSTNFRFRQAFADSFRSATIPQEESILFLTRNADSFSANFSFEREEVLFPGRSLVIRRSPSIEFVSLGKPLGNLPLIFHLRAAAEGLSRVDSVLESPRLVQRLDFRPRLALRLPELAGFSVMPSAGFRQTYYGARILASPQPEIISQSLHRQYADFAVDVRTPTLERDFNSTWLGPFRHVIEPFVRYRWIRGVNRLDETIRFDEIDAIADTNEMEYGIVNRIYRTRTDGSGNVRSYEFLSLSLAQKYYFDPDFGGAFREGQPNIFYPLNTLTGFSLTGIQRHLAPTSMAMRLSPDRGISFDVRADFDTKLQRFRDASLSTYWQQEKVFVAGTYFKTNALESGALESHHIQGQAGYGSPLRGFSASTTLSYNIDSSKLLNSHTRLHYAWDCCGIGVEFQQFDLGQRIETRFSFSFSLKGIGNFGTLKRPESLF